MGWESVWHAQQANESNRNEKQNITTRKTSQLRQHYKKTHIQSVMGFVLAQLNNKYKVILTYTAKKKKQKKREIIRRNLYNSHASLTKLHTHKQKKNKEVLTGSLKGTVTNFPLHSTGGALKWTTDLFRQVEWRKRKKKGRGRKTWKCSSSVTRI